MAERHNTRIDARAQYAPRFKEVLRGIFHGNKAPIMAVQEFLDNSFGFRNRTGGKPTEVFADINTVDGYVSVADIGGRGGDAKSIEGFFQLGETENVGLSIKGSGAKLAALYLGKHLQLAATKAGEDMQYSTTIPRFGDTTLGYEQPFTIFGEQIQGIKDATKRLSLEKGVFETTVSDLNEDAKAALEKISLTDWQKALAETYRPLLVREAVRVGQAPNVTRQVVKQDGSIDTVSDGVVLHLTVARSKKPRVQVMPLEIPLAEGSENLQVGKTSTGEAFGYWVGEMDLNNPKAQAVTPGVRVYYDGRLLTNSFFGNDANSAVLAGLTGEVHLDNIVGIKDAFSINKTAGIDTDHPGYVRLSAEMNKILAPLVDRLKQKAEDSKQDTRLMKDVLSQAQTMVNNILKDLDFSGLLAGQTLGGSPTPGERKSQQPKDEEKHTGFGHASRPPSENAGEKRIPAKSAVDDIRCADLPNPEDVSGLDIHPNPKTGRPEKILILNAQNPEVKHDYLDVLERKGVRRGPQITGLDQLSNDERLRIIHLVGLQLIEQLANETFAEGQDLTSYRQFIRTARHKLSQQLFPTK